MKNLYKFYILLASLISYTKQHSSQNINENWPEDKNKPFPYPTPGPLAIDTQEVREIWTPTPLQFNINPIEFSRTTNFGDTLVSQIAVPVIGDLTGGVLYKDRYIYFQCEFFWDDDLKPDAGDKIDGRGTSFQAVASFWNTKYPSKDVAITKRDGVVSIVVPIDVIKWPILPNFLFFPFQLHLESLEKAGSSQLVSEFLEYIWYLTPSITNDYYAYPGQYRDPKTGKVYYSATVLVFNRTPRPYITYLQFKRTFGNLRNKSGNLYSHTQTIKPRNGRPIVRARGIRVLII